MVNMTAQCEPEMLSSQREESFENVYFSGARLYGDDFCGPEITKWFQQEEYSYFSLAQSYKKYVYPYHALNFFHAFRFLNNSYEQCLAFGCAKGDDVAPLAARVERFVAVEPAEKWWSEEISGKPAQYLKPLPTGDLPLAEASVDLLVCSAVLHHIPNVTHVLSEFARVLRPKGHLVLREPISTMGDWREPRRGLTANERGFPPGWIESRAELLGLQLVRRRYCMFPLIPRFERLLRLSPVYNSTLFVLLDYVLSLSTKWNLHYHRDSVWKKMAPGQAFWTFEK